MCKPRRLRTAMTPNLFPPPSSLAVNTRDPNIVDAHGRRQIASHYYPLIGPYASDDAAVVEYQLRLMAAAGVDGVLIDWYGVHGSNGDLPMLRRGTDALVRGVEAASGGLCFALVMEDRHWTEADAAANLAYANATYFASPAYARDAAGRPRLLVFGPIRLQQPAEWEAALSNLGQISPSLLTLMYQSTELGGRAAGEFAWQYASPSRPHLQVLRTFLRERAPALAAAAAVAYAGFDDFYEEGGRKALFHVPYANGSTLASTLALADEYASAVDFVQVRGPPSRRKWPTRVTREYCTRLYRVAIYMSLPYVHVYLDVKPKRPPLHDPAVHAVRVVQLATWNDYGEGTMLEPTVERGYASLVQLARWTGRAVGEREYEIVHQLYVARGWGACAEPAEVARRLDAASTALVVSEFGVARRELEAAEGLCALPSPPPPAPPDPPHAPPYPPSRFVEQRSARGQRGACRNLDIDGTFCNRPGDCWDEMQGSGSSCAACADLCAANSAQGGAQLPRPCLGYECSDATGRCELWSVPASSVAPNSAYQCWSKRVPPPLLPPPPPQMPSPARSSACSPSTPPSPSPLSLPQLPLPSPPPPPSPRPSSPPPPVPCSPPPSPNHPIGRPGTLPPAPSWPLPLSSAQPMPWSPLPLPPPLPIAPCSSPTSTPTPACVPSLALPPVVSLPSPRLLPPSHPLLPPQISEQISEQISNLGVAALAIAAEELSEGAPSLWPLASLAGLVWLLTLAVAFATQSQQRVVDKPAFGRGVSARRLMTLRRVSTSAHLASVDMRSTAGPTSPNMVPSCELVSSPQTPTLTSGWQHSSEASVRSPVSVASSVRSPVSAASPQSPHTPTSSSGWTKRRRVPLVTARCMVSSTAFLSDLLYIYLLWAIVELTVPSTTTIDAGDGVEAVSSLHGQAQTMAWFATASVCASAGASAIFAAASMRAAWPQLRGAQLRGAPLTHGVAALLSVGNPDLLRLLPWSVRTHGGLPTQRLLVCTLLPSLLEDAPLAALKVAGLISGHLRLLFAHEGRDASGSQVALLEEELVRGLGLTSLALSVLALLTRGVCSFGRVCTLGPTRQAARIDPTSGTGKSLRWLSLSRLPASPLPIHIRHGVRARPTDSPSSVSPSAGELRQGMQEIVGCAAETEPLSPSRRADRDRRAPRGGLAKRRTPPTLAQLESETEPLTPQTRASTRAACSEAPGNDRRLNPLQRLTRRVSFTPEDCADSSPAQSSFAASELPASFAAHVAVDRQRGNSQAGEQALQRARKAAAATSLPRSSPLARSMSKGRLAMRRPSGTPKERANAPAFADLDTPIHLPSLNDPEVNRIHDRIQARGVKIGSPRAP